MTSFTVLLPSSSEEVLLTVGDQGVSIGADDEFGFDEVYRIHASLGEVALELNSGPTITVRCVAHLQQKG